MSKKTKRERLARLQRRKLYIIGGVTALLLIAGAVALVALLQKGEPSEFTGEATPEEQAAIDAAVKRTKDAGKLSEQAEAELKATGDPAKAAAVYERAVADTSEVERKIELYIDLAKVYHRSGKVEEAIEAAKKAENQSSDKFLAADWLGRMYEHEKEYTNAAAYYKIAGTMVASPQNIYNFDKERYDQAIERVTRLQQEAK